MRASRKRLLFAGSGALLGAVFGGVLGMVGMFALFLVLTYVNQLPYSALGSTGFVDPLLALQKEKKEIIAKMEAMMKPPEGETVKSFNDDEQKSYDALDVKLDAINAAIDRQIKIEANKKAAMAAGNNGVTTEQPEAKAAKQFRFTEVFAAGEAREATGLVREMHEEGAKEMRELGITPKDPRSIIIPSYVLEADKAKGEQRDMTATGGSGGDQGGTYIETALQGFIPALYARMVLTQLGADMLTGLRGNIDFPAEATTASHSWQGENVTLTESNPTTAKKSLSPNRLGTFVDVSNQLLLQNSVGAENRLRNQLITTAMIAWQTAAINGSGSSSQPEGILQTSGIGAVYAGNAAGDGTNADGAAPVWADIVNLVRAVAIDNADLGSLGYLLNPQLVAKLQTTEKATNTAQFIMGETRGQNGLYSLNGYNAGSTTLVPSNLEKGSSGTTLSAMIFGNFNDLILGQWGGMEVMANPYTKAKDGITEFIMNLYVDCLVLRAESFAAGDDFVTT